MSFTLTVREAPTGVSNLRSAYATRLWALLGATGLVLLLACANLANLMLARSSARSHEIAVRLAIGASRRRVVRQMLSESALLAGCGGLGGLLLARWISETLVRFLNAGRTTTFMDLSPDWRVFLFVLGSAVLTCVLFGLGPALQATRRDVAATIQPGNRSAGDGRGTVALRRGLVVVHVALSIVLVVGALLFGRTLKKLASVELGFNPRVLVAAVDLRRTAVPPEARIQTFAEIVTRLEQVPGVRQAAETLIVPLSGADWNGQITRGGVVQDGDVHFNAVGGSYFRVMETRLLAGRTFDLRDGPEAQKVAVVNETFAQRYLPHADPIGQTFQVDVPRSPKPTYQIVGLVRDAKFLQVREERTLAAVSFSGDERSAMFLPIAYLALAQELPRPPDLRIVIRADLPPAAVTPALTRAITQAAPGAAVLYDTVDRYIDALLVPERLMAWLSGFFGVLALLIAAIGLYGVIAYTVTRRKVEIGVRMALGADRRNVVRMVLLESGTLVAAGIGLGMGLAMVATRYSASLLYGLAPLDPTSFAIAIGALASVGVLASWIPARRAAQLDPTVALRE